MGAGEVGCYGQTGSLSSQGLGVSMKGLSRGTAVITDNTGAVHCRMLGGFSLAFGSQTLFALPGLVGLLLELLGAMGSFTAPTE